MDEKQQRFDKAFTGVSKNNAFDYFNVIFFIVMCFVMLFPFWMVLMTSLVGPLEASSRIFIWWPRDITFNWYKYVYTTERIPRAFFITGMSTILGTVWAMFLNMTMSYSLTKDSMPGQKFFVGMLLFTMFFGGGIIPYYLLLRSMGMTNTFTVLWFPATVGVWNFMLIRAFIKQIPDGLEDSAKIDGANELWIFIRVIIPLSLPVIAALSLFTAVGIWNSYYSAMVFNATRADLQTLQLVLRKMIVEKTNLQEADNEFKRRFGSQVLIFEDGIRMATVVVATVPILVVYPFLQKYFVKGIYLGSIKG